MQMQPPSTNGNHAAPRAERGAAVVRPAPPPTRPETRFPAPLAGGGLDGLLFRLGRGTFFGITLMRVLVFLVVFTAVTWALRPLPGGAWFAAALLAGLAIVAIARMVAARRNFAKFEEQTDAAADPAPLPVQEKLPVYLWGALEVQGRVRSFAALPGFYRTFATREHALIGLAQAPSRMGLSPLPDLDAGLWYAFCRPELLIALRRGSLAWGGVSYPALALTYRTARTLANGGTQSSTEMLYVAAREAETIRRIAADLDVERAATSRQSRQTAQTDTSN